MLASALLVGLALGLPEQLGDHQQVKQLKAIIDRRGLQMHNRRQQRRDTSRRRMLTQPRRLRRHPIPRQIHQPPRRHKRPHAAPVDAEPVDLSDPPQRQAKALPRWMAWTLAPPLKIREPRSLRDLQQPLQHLRLMQGRDRRERLP